MKAETPKIPPSPSPRTALLTPVGLFIMTFLVRSGFAFVAFGNGLFVPLQPDAADYRCLSRHIRESHSYGFGTDWRNDNDLVNSPWSFFYDDGGVSMLRPPGMSAFLAVIESLGCRSVYSQQVAMSAVDALAVVGVYLLGRSWLGFPVGLVAGLLLCVNPGMCYAVTKCGREPLLTLSIVYGCLGFLSAVRSNSVHSAILTGICFGLGGHVKETTAIVGVFIGAATILINRVYWRQTLIIVVSMALTMVPWVLRNSIHRGKLTGFSMPSLPVYNGSVDLGWIARQPPELQRRLDPRFAADPYDADQRLSQLIRIYSRAEPVQMAKSVAANLAFHWSPLPRHLTLNLSQCRGIDFISGGYYVVVFGLAACGAWRHRRQRFALAVVAVLVFVTFMHAPSGGFPRFRIPFEAGTALLAGALTVRRLERDTVS